MALNLPIRRLESTGLSAAAATLTSTWSSPTGGTDTASSNLSTLASPYSSYAHAFIFPGTSVAVAATAGDEDAGETTPRPVAALVLAPVTEERRSLYCVGRGKNDLGHGFVRIEEESKACIFAIFFMFLWFLCSSCGCVSSCDCLG